MTDFALATLTEFCQCGPISKINFAISLYRQVTDTRKPSDQKPLPSLYRLAGALVLRWFHSRQDGDLDEAVSLLQDCLRRPHLNHPYLRSRLCACLVTKFSLTAQTDVIIEAAHLRRQLQDSYNVILVVRQGLQAAEKFESSGDVADLDSAISLLEDAACMTSDEDYFRCDVLKALS